MHKGMDEEKSRRKFLRLLAGSPLLVSSGLLYGPLGRLMAAGGGLAQRSKEFNNVLTEVDDVITSPDQGLDVMDFEPAARAKLPPAHWGDITGGVDDDGTVRANREGFTKFEIRARRLVNISKIDMSVRLFGTTYDNPIVVAPVGSHKMLNPEGEIATAKAARAKGHLQILSTGTTTAVEDVIAARGGPVWYQLYPTDVWEVTRGLVKRAEAAGCPAVVLTVDVSRTNRETAKRFERKDQRQCSTCHEPGLAGFLHQHPMFNALDVSKVTDLHPMFLDWDFVKRLKDLTTMKLLIKGILTKEDAQLAVENGVDGIIVSNHGGRSVASNRSTIESLPEVLEGVKGKFPVLVDGGFRRGTDVFKALAMGATAIGIGRPYLWGLAAFGEPGVEAVLGIMRAELLVMMRQAGTTSIDKITQSYLVKA